MADQDTPHKDRAVIRTPNTAGAAHSHSLREPTLQEYRQRLVQEMTNRSVPLPMKSFLDTFLPVPPGQKPKWTAAALRRKFTTLKKVNNAKVKEAIVADKFVSSPIVLPYRVTM